MTHVVELLCELVRFDTRNPDGDEHRFAEHLATRLGAFRPDEVSLTDTGNGHAYVLATFGAPRTLLNAHLDTVPAGSGWSRDPFVPEVREGRVYALGAADTKGSIAAVLSALAHDRPRDLAILFSGDEERGNTTMRAFLAEHPLVPRLTRAIVCEPTMLQVGTRHRGIAAYTAAMHGEGGHSSRADTLPRPIARLARLATRLDDWGQAARSSGPPGFPGMCLNVAELRGGVAFNVVPAAAELVWSVRPPPGVDVVTVSAEMAALVPSDVSFRPTLENPSFETKDLASFRSLLGARVKNRVDLGFWTEAALIAERGVDAVVWGPGDIAAAHAPDESVAVEQLEGATFALRELFRGPV